MSARPTPLAIRIFRCLRLALHFLWVGVGTALIYPLLDEAGRRRRQKIWSHQILKILAVRLETSWPISPAATPGCLLVANHISWLDIFVINALRPAAFISKAEVRGWPFIGWLAARNHTVFLRRGSRGHERLVNTEIDALLNAGKDVAIFPEGTTTDGTQLLGFHAALLQPAIETARPLLPLAIAYRDAEGRPSPAPSFAGETTLAQCFSAILASRTLTAHVVVLPAIASTGMNRRELSQAAHTAIGDALGLPTRPESPRQNKAPGTTPGPQGE